MDAKAIAGILNSGSAALQELTQDVPAISGFLDLLTRIDDLPETDTRFYEQGVSLFQSIAKGPTVDALEQLLATFFGPPDKPAGKPLPLTLRFNSSAKCLGGIQKDQSLFIKKTPAGELYGALWPWQRKKGVTTIHLGFCSEQITDEDYNLLETLVKKTRAQALSQKLGGALDGAVRGVSLTSFLQMAEMEASSCTLRVTSDGRVGLLYVRDGKLLDAKTEAIQNREAAFRIIAWQNPEIEILPAAEKTEDAIGLPLMQVLMESLKNKDEHRQPARQPELSDDEITLEMEPKATPEPEVPPLPLEKTPPAKPVGAPETHADTAVPPAVPPGIMPKKDTKEVLLSKVSADKRILTVVAVVGLVLVLVVGMIILRAMQSGRAEKGYAQLLAQVAKAPELEQKEALLLDFIATQDSNEYTLDAEERLKDIERLKEERDYEATSRQLAELAVDYRYQARALALYDAFRVGHPDSARLAEFKQMIDEIVEMVDDMEYEALTNMAQQDLGVRLKAYAGYLEHHPAGKYRAQVEGLTAGLSELAYRELTRDVKELEKKGRFDEAIANCVDYRKLFAHSARLDAVADMQTRLQDRKDVAALIALAADKGEDDQAARTVFADYLLDHPGTSQKAEIQKEIDLLDRKIRNRNEWQQIVTLSRNQNYAASERIQEIRQFVRKNPAGPFVKEANALLTQLEGEALVEDRRRQQAARQQQAAAQVQQAEAQRQSERQRLQRLAENVRTQIKQTQGRYVSSGDEIVRDTTTGLMWAVLDSHLEMGRCLNYEGAVQYVRILRNGGYSDWRLPTAAELAGIYKNSPFFPATGAKWYWTSETYVKGYSRIANVVTAKRETVFKREYFDLDQCGAVRAVRP